ncbi:MAG: 6-phosphogluconolactonase [Paracoccaceae bacterium]
MILQEYPDREMLYLALAEVMAEELSEIVVAEGRATLSVPGGTTPGPVFDLLSGVDLGWSRVAVVLNDERWVPESSPRSNTALLKARLLQGPAASATLLPLYADAPEPEAALSDLSAVVGAHLPLSVLLLGMGADMHTASLFPGADCLAEALAPDAPVLMPMRAPGAGEPRVTLTAPVLAAARHIHILITGAEKRTALHAARHLAVAEAPVRAVLDNATVHWAE